VGQKRLLRHKSTGVRLSEWDSGPGVVPAVQPQDIRNALEILGPLKRLGITGIVGLKGRSLADCCDPSSDISAVCMRTGVLLIILEKGLSNWREGDTLPDAVFQVAATYPLTFGEDKNLNINSFLTALGGQGGHP
jgi:hypothetical protein